MSVDQLKLIWPALIVPEVREWGNRPGCAWLDPAHRDRRQFTGSQSFAEGAANPDDGLSVNIVANGATILPVDGLPPVHDADLKAM